MALEFETAVRRREAEVAGVEKDRGPATVFKVAEYDAETDELVQVVECNAYNPGTDAIVMLMADATGRRQGNTQKAVGVIDFFFSTLDDAANDYLYKRLVDPDDPLGIEEITRWLIGDGSGEGGLLEEWGGRPTKQPSDFARSRKTGGQRSTARTSPSTSSRSRSTASSTRSTRSTSST